VNLDQQTFHESQNDEQEGRLVARAKEVSRVRHYHQESADGISAKAQVGIYYAWHSEKRMIYIGSSKNVLRRWSDHVARALNGSNNYFHKKLREFGASSFTFGIIETCEQAERFHREEFWITAFDSTGRSGLNTQKHPTRMTSHEITDATRRRIGDSSRGRKHSKNACAKIGAASRKRTRTLEQRKASSIALKGRIITPEWRAKISAGKLGIKHTLESRAKMSASRTGIKLTQEHRAKISAAKLGEKRTPEQRARISSAHIGIMCKPETREKLRVANLGKKHSPEGRANIIAGLLRERAKKLSHLNKLKQMNLFYA